jgi:hypothetical protein
MNANLSFEKMRIDTSKRMEIEYMSVIGVLSPIFSRKNATKILNIKGLLRGPQILNIYGGCECL